MHAVNHVSDMEGQAQSYGKGRHDTMSGVLIKKLSHVREYVLWGGLIQSWLLLSEKDSTGVRLQLFSKRHTISPRVLPFVVSVTVSGMCLRFP